MSDVLRVLATWLAALSDSELERHLQLSGAVGKPRPQPVKTQSRPEIQLVEVAATVVAGTPLVSVVVGD